MSNIDSVEKLRIEANCEKAPIDTLSDVLKNHIATYGLGKVAEAFNDAINSLSEENPDDKQLSYVKDAANGIQNPMIAPIIKIIEEFGIFNFLEILKGVLPNVHVDNDGYKNVLKYVSSSINNVLYNILTKEDFVKSIKEEGFNLSNSEE